MRAVVLSKKSVIDHLNQNFVNVWVLNYDLKKMRDERGIDNLPPLAKSIINSWKQHSPVDCLVISPELKLLGRQPVNELFSSGGFSYRAFLDHSVQGKRPGLSDQSSQDRLPSREIEQATQGKIKSNGSNAERPVEVETSNGTGFTIKDGKLLNKDGEVVGSTDLGNGIGFTPTDKEQETEKPDQSKERIELDVKAPEKITVTGSIAPIEYASLDVAGSKK